MKWVRPMLLGLGVAVLVAVAALALLYAEMRRPADDSGEPARFTVERGEPLVGVLARLHERGVIAHPRAVRVFAALRGVDRRIQSGTYVFSAAEPPADILERLVTGDVLRIAVTVREGLTRWEIAAAFEPAGIDSAALLAVIESGALRERRRIDAPSLEGYLFPDTYLVPFGSSPGDVVGMMLARLDEVYDARLVARTAEVEVTPHQVLTLASIVEAEARVPDERPTISAVYHNRLDRGMRLEADPTVAYAMGGYRGRLLYKHLEIDSPYNTYRNAGLPPGPICSPGQASIEAALWPREGVDALYFVARGDGSHIFSRTLAEHNAAVRRVRRNR